MTADERDQTILQLNQSMLECVLRGDWDGYAAHCDVSVSCFEAETNGILVEGLEFHRFYFDSPAATAAAAGSGAAEASSAVQTQLQPLSQSQVTMARPHLRWLGDDAVVLSYTRLVQRCSNGEFTTSSCCETRIWQQRLGQWKQVHVHRS